MNRRQFLASPAVLIFASDEPMKNLILNGAMRFDSVNAHTTLYQSSQFEVYGPDQWRYAGVSAAQFSFGTRVVNFRGYKRALSAEVTTAKSSVGSMDNDHIEYPVEGRHIRKLMWGTGDALPLVVKFYAAAAGAGDYSLALMEGKTNWISCVKTFNIPTAGPFYKIFLTFPACTAGTWSTDDDTFGLKLIWDLGSGSAWEASALDSWLPATAAWRAGGSNVVRLTTVSGGVLRITGVEAGPDIQSTDPDLDVPMEWEERQLQRYFFKTFPRDVPVKNGLGVYDGALSYVAGGSAGGCALSLPAEMCSPSPTYSFCSPGANDGNWFRLGNPGASSGAPAAFMASRKGAFVYNGTAEGPNAIAAVHAVVNSRLGR